MRRSRSVRMLGVLVALAVLTLRPAYAIDCTKTALGLAPITDLGAGEYLGAQGGLYPGGSNERPAAHTALGESLARQIVPRTIAGVPDAAAGKIVFLSIGMSNTRNEFTQFVPMSNADPLRHPRVQAINGAIGGQAAEDIASPTSPYWTQVYTILAQNQASAQQVQAIWLKQANRTPTGSFPAYAKRLQADLQAIVQDLVVYFPNVKVVYLSSRIYAGYATTALNPEPYAYGSAWSVKWLVESQIDGTFVAQNPTRGVVAPWLSWGPYLWADGLRPRADGLVWECSDFQSDGTHPNTAGSKKVAGMILDFVHTDPTARLWYVEGGATA